MLANNSNLFCPYFVYEVFDVLKEFQKGRWIDVEDDVVY